MFVRHGSIFVRVSPNRLQKVGNYLNQDEEVDDKQEAQSNNNDSREIQEASPTISEDIPAESYNREVNPTTSDDMSTDGPNEDSLQRIKHDRKALKVNDTIQYKLQNNNSWIKATVLGRAGKATGKNKNWYNIQEDVSREKKSINLNNVQWELITDDVNINKILKQDSGDSEVTTAKVTELQKLKQFKTYEEVKDCG